MFRSHVLSFRGLDLIYHYPEAGRLTQPLNPQEIPSPRSTLPIRPAYRKFEDFSERSNLIRWQSAER